MKRKSSTGNFVRGVNGSRLQILHQTADNIRWASSLSTSTLSPLVVACSLQCNTLARAQQQLNPSSKWRYALVFIVVVIVHAQQGCLPRGAHGEPCVGLLAPFTNDAGYINALVCFPALSVLTYALLDCRLGRCLGSSCLLPILHPCSTIRPQIDAPARSRLPGPQRVRAVAEELAYDFGRIDQSRFKARKGMRLAAAPHTASRGAPGRTRKHARSRCGFFGSLLGMMSSSLPDALERCAAERSGTTSHGSRNCSSRPLMSSRAHVGLTSACSHVHAVMPRACHARSACVWPRVRGIHNGLLSACHVACGSRLDQRRVHVLAKLHFQQDSRAIVVLVQRKFPLPLVLLQYAVPLANLREVFQPRYDRLGPKDARAAVLTCRFRLLLLAARRTLGSSVQLTRFCSGLATHVMLTGFRSTRITQASAYRSMRSFSRCSKMRVAGHQGRLNSPSAGSTKPGSSMSAPES